MAVTHFGNLAEVVNIDNILKVGMNVIFGRVKQRRSAFDFVKGQPRLSFVIGSGEDINTAFLNQQNTKGNPRIYGGFPVLTRNQQMANREPVAAVVRMFETE